MSSPTNQMNTSAHVASSNYSAIDAVNRRDYGVQKNRKPASTGGGRAWSEDEVRICSYHLYSKLRWHFPLGGLSPPNPASENALQTHSRSS